MRTTAVIATLLTLTACASLEHGIVDSTTFERDLPLEVRRAQDADNLSFRLFLRGDAALNFEAGRRFESGEKGFPEDLVCAHAFYTHAGELPFRTMTNINGISQRENYNGLPNGRLAARRLEREQNVRSVGSVDLPRCTGAIPG